MFLIFNMLPLMTISDAWDKYGRGKGRETLQTMHESLNRMKKKNNLQMNNDIGCIILRDVFFLDKWIDEPADWGNSIVSGRKYDTDEEIGAELYKTIWESINKSKKTDEQIVEEIETEISLVKGQERIALVKVRANQSVFRDRLLSRYNHCCLCNVENPALLIASHIKPWAESQASEKLDVDNGFLLCPNHDVLFDGGFITFDEDGTIVVSDRLSQEDCISTKISPNMKVDLTAGNKKYMEYHREKVFKNTDI